MTRRLCPSCAAALKRWRQDWPHEPRRAFRRRRRTLARQCPRCLTQEKAR